MSKPRYTQSHWLKKCIVRQVPSGSMDPWQMHRPSHESQTCLSQTLPFPARSSHRRCPSTTLGTVCMGKPSLATEGKKQRQDSISWVWPWLFIPCVSSIAQLGQGTPWGVGQTPAGLRGFFGIWVGFRVKAREGQEVKCLQGPSELGPSHPPTSGAGQGLDTSGLCKRDSPGPTQPGLGEGAHAGWQAPSPMPQQGGSGKAGWAQRGRCASSRLSADCLLVWSEAVAVSVPPSTGASGLLPNLQGPPAPSAPHLRSRCSYRRGCWGQGGHSLSCLPSTHNT